MALGIRLNRGMSDVLTPPGTTAHDTEGPGDGVEAVALATATQPALGKAVGQGAAWLLLTNIIGKGAGIVTFMILGWLVTYEEYAVWTMAFTFAAFTQFFRDGGVTQLLVQRGEKQYEALAGSVFWMALTFNAVSAAVLAGLSPIAASSRFYNTPELLPLLLIIAGTMPFITLSTVYWVRLQTQLRFRLLSNLQAASSLIRYGLMIAGAWMGLGPLSFVLPIPVVVLFESIAYYLAVRDKPWRRPPRVKLWRSLFSDSKWLVFATFAAAVLNTGPYFLLGAIVVKERLGAFSFGYQLVGQIDQLLAATAAMVLLPALARLNDEPVRQRGAILRASRLMTFAASVASLGLVAVLVPAETLIWAGKRADSVFSAQVIGVVFAWRVLLCVPAPALQARGQFRFSAVLMLLAGLALMAAAWVGAKVGGGDPGVIAIAIGIVTGVGLLGFSLWGFHKAGVSPRDVIKGTVPVWLCSVVACAIALVASHFAQPMFGHMPGRWGALGNVLLSGTVFVGAVYVLVRLAAPEVLREAGGILPARLHFLRRYLG